MSGVPGALQEGMQVSGAGPVLTGEGRVGEVIHAFLYLPHSGKDQKCLFLLCFQQLAAMAKTYMCLESVRLVFAC